MCGPHESNTVDVVLARVREFARAYVAVVEALMAEGVPEEAARLEARMVALVAITFDAGRRPRQPWED